MEKTDPQTPKEKVDAHRSSEFNPQVSWFTRASENLSDKDVPASDVIQAIRNGQWKADVEAIRKRFAFALERADGNRKDAKKAVDSLKKRLPAVTFSGKFGIRSCDKLKAHSGLICADLDNLGDRLERVRATLAKDPHVYGLFASPTGDGLKAAYRGPVCEGDAQHKAAFKAVAAHVKQTTGVEIDATPDSSRLCFVSYDPETVINPAAVELPVDFSAEATAGQSGSDSASSAHANERTDRVDRIKIEKIVGPVDWESETCGFCKCPGEHLHTGANGPQDCRVNLSDEGTWYLHCFHTSCKKLRAAKNRELRKAFNGLPDIENAAKLIAEGLTKGHPPEVIEGVLHQGSKGIVGGGSKTRKTWVLVDMALSVANGDKFWNWNTTKGRVCYINFEIQPSFFAARLTEVAMAKNITNFDNLDVWNLRGHATSFDELIPQLIEALQNENYTLVIIDPVYKGLGGRDENAAGDIGQLCNEIERLAVKTGAAVVFAAHYSKGNQAGKESMDRISGSGVFARDADSIITLTKHKEDNCLTVDVTLRNFQEQPAFVVRWKFPLMSVEESLDPEDLKQKAGRKKEHCSEEALEVLSQKGPMTIGDWRDSCEEDRGIKERSFYKLRSELEANGSIRPCSGTKKWEACKPRFRAGPSTCFPRPCLSDQETATTA